jgi:hypothetical protein
MTSTTLVFGFPLMLLIISLSLMEPLLSLIVITDFMLMILSAAASPALIIVPVALVPLFAYNVMPTRTLMPPASATLVTQQLNTVLLARSVVILSGAIAALKAKDL